MCLTKILTTAMIFTELVDLVLLSVNGGEFTSEAAVQRPDVESYVPQAAHTVIRNAVFGLKADKRSELGATGSIGVQIDPGFFETYTLTVAFDETRQIHYADLPSVIQSWPGDNGINAVFGKTNPGLTFVKVNGAQEYSAFGDLADAMSVYWHEPASSGTSYFSRIFLPSADDGVCDIMVRAALEISPALGETRIPLPVGLEAMVCQMAIEWFRGQRGMPADNLLTNNDVNATQVAQQ